LADNGWQPYFKLNYWHGRSGEDRILFDSGLGSIFDNSATTVLWHE
jgi:hypothetical protein